MVYIKWIFLTVFWGIVLAILHYTLPQNDIVRVADTYEKRIDFGENSLFWAAADVGNDTTAVNRDVFFIQTIRPNDRPLVYRNEDTGWGWPPYFKFDTSNLQAEATDFKSSKDAPQWVAVRHYGWRNEFLSIFPNAVGVTKVEGPDVRIFPWFNVIFLIVFFALIYAIWVRWRRFRMARIDPLLGSAGDAWDRVGADTTDRRGRISRWFRSWRGPDSRQ